jgi:vitamin B12 transporter
LRARTDERATTREAFNVYFDTGCAAALTPLLDLVGELRRRCGVLASIVLYVFCLVATAPCIALADADEDAGAPEDTEDTPTSPADALPVPDPGPVLTESQVASPMVVVSVRGASKVERLRTSAQAVKVIDTTEDARRTADLGEVLARTEGVSVQRSGGLGSDMRLSLHGLRGDQVRVFMDGIPLELTGFGLGISTVPLHWTQRVEIYRGVVPIRLGADALGGAIDIITDLQAMRTSASASYTTGAFDTHQLGLEARTHDAASGFYLRAHGFFDVTRNDYLIDVRVPDELGRLRDAKVRRFHDGYRAGGAAVEAGFADRTWARRLALRLFGTDFSKQLQHNIDMSVPYGGVNYGQTALGATVRYDAPLLAADKLAIDAVIGFGHRAIDFEDKSRWSYDWFGRRITEHENGAAETSNFASDLTQWEQRLYARAGFAYRFTPEHSARWVSALDITHRKGEERLRARADRLDPLTSKRQIMQLTSGLEYALRAWSNRIENSAFGKHYLFQPLSDQVDTFENAVKRLDNTTHRFGAGDALRVRVVEEWYAKLSYEYAARLPRPDEIFGDGARIVPNLELAPESSHNANVGLLAQRVLPEQLGDMWLELSGFLRHSRDMIADMMAQDLRHLVFRNVSDVRTLGLEGMVAYQSPGRFIDVRANATWQDMRNASSDGFFAPFNNYRMPNRPWLFANATAALRIPDFGASDAVLSVAWTTRYVHEFSATWETDGSDDRHLVASQLTHALGLLYSVAAQPFRVVFALDVSNITDARAFDVIGVQKPGRAAFFKINVCWECADAT